jgi:chemotaxis protein methyltransferase CheR
VAAEALRVPSPAVDGLTEKNFQRLAELIQGYSGIKMPATKRTMLEGRLRRRVRATRAASLDEYCRRLFDEDGLAAELVDLMDAVTTNKTEFFREPSHFDFLRDHGLATLLKAERPALKAWSAACSIGAEPYTLAMVIEDYLQQSRRRTDYSILCTDLCTEVLQEALAGIYSPAMIEPVPMDLRRRYLMRARERDRPAVRIVPRLRSRLLFARLNLMDETYPADDDMDMIFCRNILIYFDKPTQSKVLRRLCSHLRPGGLLFLGHSESVVGIELPVKQIASTVFQRC